MPRQKYKKRSDGRYCTTFRGKTVYGRTSSELEDKITELKYLHKTGFIFDNDNITFKEYALNWLNLQIQINPNKSFERETRLLKNYILPEIGLIQLKSLKKSNILQLQANMINKDLKESTNRAIILVKNILNSAIDDNLITKNVALNIKGKSFEKVSRKPLTKKEDEILLEASKINKYGLFFLFMRYCGLRPEEARALTFKDINLDKQYVNVDKAFSYAKNEKGELKDTKNLVHRQVPVMNFMIPQIKLAIQNSKEHKTDILFYKQSNPHEYMSKSSYNSCVNSFLNTVNQLAESKIKFIPYQLRHSYCTMLYYSGIGLKEAQDLMGDKNSKMILDVYTHLQKENESSLEKLNLFFNSQKIVKN